MPRTALGGVAGPPMSAWPQTPAIRCARCNAPTPALRLLGVATEVLRGRQRTRTERLASWRVGDRGRGWASVWALHDDAQLARLVGALSPQPEGFWFFTLPKGDGYYQQPPPFRRR